MNFIDDDELDLMKGRNRKDSFSGTKIEFVENNNVDYSYIVPEKDRIQINRVENVFDERYFDFDKEKYKYSLNFYDFEVFRFDWCVTIINPVENMRVVVANDFKALKKYYDDHCEQIWVGYNSRNYDVYILKSILLGMNPKKVNDDLIVRGMKGWQISQNFKKVKLLNFDVYTKNPLKVLEGFMGSDIRETEVDFDIDRKLTAQEMRQTIRYNVHDVEQTIEVFRRNHYLYDSQLQLVETFNMPLHMIEQTQSQLASNILECDRKEREDEFDIKIVDKIRLEKYKYAYDWFMNFSNMDYKKSFSMDVCGVPHRFGWGGIHGAPEKPIHRKGRMFHIDVTSYYPNLMIKYGFLTRNSRNPKLYENIYDIRVSLKQQGKKKEQAPYKIVLNGTYGITKDKYSAAYDPRQANNICINGQLMLLDLLERLEGHIDLIQSNTDGLIIQVDDNKDEIDKVIEICHMWENRFGMRLEFDEIEEIFQKDVNNYIFRFSNGKLERKGAYVMELDDLNYDLPIINRALVNYMMNDVPVERTINDCDELREFQKIVKISSNYRMAWHNNRYLNGKVFRVFASKDVNDTYFGKVKRIGATIEKFANTPDNAFIVNDNVNGVKVTKKLDKRWYVNLARQRLRDFGVDEDVFNGGLF